MGVAASWIYMAFVGFTGSRGERPAQAARSGMTRRQGEVPQRARSDARPAAEIAATVSVLVLIMIGALAVRFLLSLANGIVH